MADKTKCPVCGKVGIPDYLAEDAICPQCGSDLSIFRVIDQIPEEQPRKRNVWMPIAAAAFLAAAVMGGILIWDSPKESISVDNQSEMIAQLNDSINILNAKLQDVDNPQVKSSQDGFKYVVKPGDSFWSISKRFYHTGTRYEEIAAANGLDTNSKLNVGDTIVIKQ